MCVKFVRLIVGNKVWDVIWGEKVGFFVGYENCVSCLGVFNDGISLCIGLWDVFVRFYFF